MEAAVSRAWSIRWSRRVEGMFIHAPDLAHMLKVLARNLDGTPSRYERIMAVKSQASGSQGREGDLSVKPSARPTLVRTQHLPPAKPQLRPSARTIRRAESARSGPPRVRPGPSWSSPADMALNCSDTGRTDRICRPGPLPCRAPDEQARNTISSDHHSATWRLPLRCLGAVVAPAAGWPGTPAWTAAERTYLDPGALTVTVGDTGWLANGRITPNRCLWHHL
jgi:hypothetical protein